MQVEGISGKYWVDCQPKTSSKVSYDLDTAKRLWDVSQELTGAKISADTLKSTAAAV